MKVQNGFSLIEVLIAMLVLAIGLLGVAALQVTSLGGGQEGYLRSQATSLAEDYASRVRANLRIQTTLAAPQYANYLTAYAGSPVTCAAVPAPFCATNAGVMGAACTPVQLIAFDRWDVCNAASTLLPGGQLRAVRNSNRLTVAVGWTQAQTRVGSGEQASAAVDPQCATLGFAANNCVVLQVMP